MNLTMKVHSTKWIYSLPYCAVVEIVNSRLPKRPPTKDQYNSKTTHRELVYQLLYMSHVSGTIKTEASVGEI